MQSEYRPWKKEKKIRRHHSQHGIYFELFSAPLAETRIISSTTAAAAASREFQTLKTRLLATGTGTSDKGPLIMPKQYAKPKCEKTRLARRFARQSAANTTRASYEAAMKSRETISCDGSRNERKSYRRQRKRSRWMCPREYNGPLLRTLEQCRLPDSVNNPCR